MECKCGHNKGFHYKDVGCVELVNHPDFGESRGIITKCDCKKWGNKNGM